MTKVSLLFLRKGEEVPTHSVGSSKNAPDRKTLAEQCTESETLHFVPWRKGYLLASEAHKKNYSSALCLSRELAPR